MGLGWHYFSFGGFMLYLSLPVAAGMAYVFGYLFHIKLTYTYEGEHRQTRNAPATWHPSDSAWTAEDGPSYPNLWRARMERTSFILRVPLKHLPRTIEWYRYQALKGWNWVNVPATELPRLWWILRGENTPREAIVL